MTELAGLFAGLDERLDVLGIPEGRPFLIGPRGEYDLALNRYFAVWLAHSPANTQAAHARDLRTFLDFSWSARGGTGWRDASAEDRVAFESWRRRDETGPRIQDSTWDREVATVNQFYVWALKGLVAGNPIRQRIEDAAGSFRAGASRGRSRLSRRMLDRVGM